jgi:hypothetical protein
VLASGGHIQALVNPLSNERATFHTSEDCPSTPEAWLDGAETRTGPSSPPGRPSVLSIRSRSLPPWTSRR